MATATKFNIHEWAAKAKLGDPLILRGERVTFIRKEAYVLFFSGATGRTIKVDVDEVNQFQMAELVTGEGEGEGELCSEYPHKSWDEAKRGKYAGGDNKLVQS